MVKWCLNWQSWTFLFNWISEIWIAERRGSIVLVCMPHWTTVPLCFSVSENLVVFKNSSFYLNIKDLQTRNTIWLSEHFLAVQQQLNFFSLKSLVLIQKLFLFYYTIITIHWNCLSWSKVYIPLSTYYIAFLEIPSTPIAKTSNWNNIPWQPARSS